MAPQLPPRKIRIIGENYKSLNKLSECLGKTDEEIKGSPSYAIYIDNIDLLKNNFDIVKKIISFKKGCTFYAKDIECLKYIEENLTDYEDVTLSLIDDFENKDRSYIDIPFFQKTKIAIPLAYVLWTPLINETQAISLYCNKDTMYPSCSNFYEHISLENLKKIREIIYQLAEKYKDFTDLEKNILISNYLQNFVQYVAEDNISEALDGTYITDSKGLEVTNKLVGSPENVLLQNFGLCNGIAHATTLLLNNPEINVNIRGVSSGAHVWNVVCLDGKYYYVDNTWNITRNKDRYPESLKARSFTSDYLLFGTDKATQIGHHIPKTYCPIVEQGDISRESIAAAQKRLIKVASFSDYNGPVFASTLKK